MKALKIFGKILAIIFCIGYFFGLTFLLFLSFANKFTSGTYYTDVIESIDLNDIKLSDLGEFANNSELSGDTSVKEALIKFFNEGGVDEKSANAIIENKEIKTVLGNYIGDYVNYNLGGKEPEISKTDIKTILTNSDVIKVTGKNPTEEDINNTYNDVKDVLKDFIKNGGVRNDNSRTNNENIINHQ